MKVILRYFFESTDSEVAIVVKKWFESQGEETSINEDNLLIAENEFDYYDEEPISRYGVRTAIKKAEALRSFMDYDLKLCGTIDTSYTAGEYMDFEISFSEGKPAVKVSDWYLETAMESYENYEDFCDCFFECTEEEYDAVKNCEFVYVLETDNGEVLVDKVPLHDWVVKD